MSREANDFFGVYYTEKIWEMIPPLYRVEDSREDNPDKGVLRALVELMGEQAALLRRSNDRLWEDQFIELCENWAVPYISALIGTRLVSSLNSRGRRTDVAKTIYYRRRKGTLRVQEEMIRDITGWDGKVVENFRRLARFRHPLDPVPSLQRGSLTGTPAGGWADIRNARGGELTGGPFDEFHHTPDFRKHRGVDGRYSIAKLAFHIYPTVVNRVFGVTPFPVDEGKSYGFDPSGRSIPLYNPDYRPAGFDWDESWHSALEWEIASPMSCRLLAHEEYLVTDQVISDMVTDYGLPAAAAKELHKIAGMRCYGINGFKKLLLSLPLSAELMNPAVFQLLTAMCLADDCGKAILLKNAVSVYVDEEKIPPDRIMAGLAENAPTTEPVQQHLLIDPQNGRLLVLDPPGSQAGKIIVDYCFGIPSAIGAGTYKRKAPVENYRINLISGNPEIVPLKLQNNRMNLITDSITYTGVPDKLSVEKLVLGASDGARPYICLQGDWTLGGAGEASELCLDGLWIGSSAPSELVITGVFNLVIIRHCTLDPGGDKNLKGEIIHPVPLFVNGSIGCLEIDSSVMGPVHLGPAGHIRNVVIRDSVIQSVLPGVPAVDIHEGVTVMERVTVMGNVRLLRMISTDSLLAGDAWVTDNQNGCFRFSAAGESSSLPHFYESLLFPLSDQNFFLSRRFGQPGYARIAETAPESLKTGSENGSEMGAFCNMANSLKSESLLNKLEEYMPFGLIPVLVYHT